MLVKSIRDYLDGQRVPYSTITHKATYTAQEIAESAHVSGKNLAKTVMVKLDGRLAMAVLPAAYDIDFTLLQKATGAKKVGLAREDEFTNLFPDYEIGAMPPFGNLHGLSVYVAESLAEDDEIAFNAGTHTDLIKMSYKDFERLVKPKVLKFSTRH